MHSFAILPFSYPRGCSLYMFQEVLELNPNGQWLWLELELGLPLAASMADLLTTHHSRAGQPTDSVRESQSDAADAIRRGSAWIGE